MDTLQEAECSALRARYEDELYEHVLPFWERHSPDTKYGGTFNNLDRDGTVYDTTKHIWLVARQVWMLSKLYRTVETRSAWIELAHLGMEFLQAHAARPNGQVYFHVARDGKPIYQQRKTFSECFYVMALAEYGRASDQPAIVHEAKARIDWLWTHSKDWGLVGRPTLEGAPQAQSLAVPMMLLNVLDEVMADRLEDCRAEVEECVRRIAMHVHSKTERVYEHVASPSGALLLGPMGRLLNPGHAIEAGWFLHHVAQRLQLGGIAPLATSMIRWSHAIGWDATHGGLFYFLDSEGYSPVQLEWSMKLWWPHCEALYGHLLNFAITGDPGDAHLFKAVDRYTFRRFPDPKYGEWYGYCDRQGNATHRFKGGPYKGCFHVPRTLWLCIRLLERWPQRPTDVV